MGKGRKKTLSVKANIDKPVQKEMHVAQLNGFVVFTQAQNLFRGSHPNSVGRVNKVIRTSVSHNQMKVIAVSRYPSVSICQV